MQFAAAGLGDVVALEVDQGAVARPCEIANVVRRSEEFFPVLRFRAVEHHDQVIVGQQSPIARKTKLGTTQKRVGAGSIGDRAHSSRSRGVQQGDRND